MEAKMNEELLSILKKYIPEQSIGLIKDELVAAEQLRKDKKELEYKLENRDTEIEVLKNRIKVLEETNSKLESRDEEVTKLADQVTTRELECEKRERNWELELLRKDLECEKAKSATMQNITSLVFASPIYRQMTQSSIQGSLHKYGQSIPYDQIQTVIDEHEHIVRPAVNNPHSQNETIHTVGK